MAYEEWDPFGDPADSAPWAAEEGEAVTCFSEAERAADNAPQPPYGRHGSGSAASPAPAPPPGQEAVEEEAYDNSDPLGDLESLEAVEAAYAAQLLESLPMRLLPAPGPAACGEQQGAPAESSQEAGNDGGDDAEEEEEHWRRQASLDNSATAGWGSSPTPARAPGSPAASASAAAAAAVEEHLTVGPEYKAGQISVDFCLQLMQWQKQGQSLAGQFAYLLILDLIELLKGLTCALVDVVVPPGQEITVCGDVHGQYYDLLHIWEINGVPSEDNPYLFNGDFVDRGSFSVEVILALFAWKLLYPGHLHLARGNHETQSMNRIYGFEGEVLHKYDEGLYNLMCEAFCLLPLCHVLNSCVFVVHGGLFSYDGVTLDDIRRIDRVCEPVDCGLMVDMLWSDPYPGWGRAASKRGVGVAFGQDVTEEFLRTNDLRLVIRSHELCEDGYSVEHSGRLITVFSAPNYCDQMGNRGAFLRLDGDTLTPRPTSFCAVPHPPVRAMQYAPALPFFYGGFGFGAGP